VVISPAVSITVSARVPVRGGGTPPQVAGAEACATRTGDAGCMGGGWSSESDLGVFQPLGSRMA